MLLKGTFFKPGSAQRWAPFRVRKTVFDEECSFFVKTFDEEALDTAIITLNGRILSSLMVRQPAVVTANEITLHHP